MKRYSIVLGAILCVLPALALHAQDIPTYPTLPCEGVCPQYVPSEVITPPHPIFVAIRGTVFRDSVVDVSFTVGVDGHAKDPIVERVIGSKNNVASALNALVGSAYKPATENGVPVAENRRWRFLFELSGAGSARPQMASLYERAVANTDRAAAMASLRALSELSDLNLYEATMIAGALAAMESDAGDYDTALRDVEIATVNKGAFLDSQERPNALRLAIQLEARAGQFAGAFADFDELKKHSGVADSDPVAQLVVKLHDRVASPQPLWIAAKIPGDEQTAIWNHTMLRRSFGFADIKGSLSKFHLRCETHGIESPVTDGATWTIPPAWTKCNILVEGTPGTTFQFGEAQPGAATAPAKPD